MRAACDILILGGGVVGASAAYHLARRRAGRVLLLEKAFLGAGASGKATAVLRRPDDDDPAAALAWLSQQFYERFPDPLVGPPVFSRTGLILLRKEDDACPSPLPRVSSLELMEIDPNAHLAEGETALYDADAGAVDPVQALASFAEAARRAGADLRQGVEVKALTVEKGKVTGVETNEGPYACGALVLAAGPWAAALARGVRAALPLQACRAQAALFRRPPDCSRRGVICLDRAQGLYFKPTPGDLIQVGGLADEPEAADPDHYDEAADDDWLRGVRQKLSRRFPAMHRAYGRGGFASVAAVTPDGLPILDRLPGVENAIAAVGFGPRGAALAPAAGQVLAALIAGATDGGPDPGPFRLARFGEPEEPKGRPAAVAASPP
jgi:sarcosine oxidase subunit beta